LWLLLFLFYLNGNISAQEKGWTLSQCIAYARENNIVVKQQELGLQNAQIVLRESQLDYLPSLNLVGNYNISGGRVLDPTTYNFIDNQTINDINGAINLNMELFGGLKKYYILKRSELNLKSSILNVEKSKNDLTLNIIACFLEILFAQEKIKITENKINLVRSQENRMQELVDIGKKTIGDLLQIQAQLANTKNEKIIANGNLKKAYLSICQLLEITDYVNFQILIPDTLSINELSLNTDIETVLNEAQKLPEINSANLQVKIAKKDVSIARSALYPKINLLSGYGSTYSDVRQKTHRDSNGNLILDSSNNPIFIRYPFQEQVRDNANYYLTLGINIPIFNSFSIKSKIRVNEVALHRAEYDYLLTRKRLNRDVEKSYIDAQTSWQSYITSQKNVETNLESFRQIEHKLNLGLSTPLDYNIATDNLINAQSQLIQAKYEYIFTILIINFYLGKPIEL